MFWAVQEFVQSETVNAQVALPAVYWVVSVWDAVIVVGPLFSTVTKPVDTFTVATVGSLL